MKKIVESGIKIVDRNVGGFPIPSLITILTDPLATPELLIYGMCEYYIPKFKDKEIILNEAKILGYNIKVVGLDALKELRGVKVCLEFEGSFKEVIELKKIAYQNELIFNLIILKDLYEDYQRNYI